MQNKLIRIVVIFQRVSTGLHIDTNYPLELIPAYLNFGRNFKSLFIMRHLQRIYFRYDKLDK